MPTTYLRATWDGKVFRPREPLALPPNTDVMLLVETPRQKTGEPGSFFRFARSLNLDGPPDWSERFDEYLEETRRAGESAPPPEDDSARGTG